MKRCLIPLALLMLGACSEYDDPDFEVIEDASPELEERGLKFAICDEADDCGKLCGGVVNQGPADELPAFELYRCNSTGLCMDRISESCEPLEVEPEGPECTTCGSLCMIERPGGQVATGYCTEEGSCGLWPQACGSGTCSDGEECGTPCLPGAVCGPSDAYEIECLAETLPEPVADVVIGGASRVKSQHACNGQGECVPQKWLFCE
ncbi:MAG: hypothetical protein AAF799_17780 [Myxococcota bacterium]